MSKPRTRNKGKPTGQGESLVICGFQDKTGRLSGQEWKGAYVSPRIIHN
jgi:hypothetical protein